MSVPPCVSPCATSTPPTSNERLATPEPFASFLYRGDELLRRGDPAQARAQAERALALRPDNPDARRLLALAFFRIGHLERALVLYEGLLLDAPESTSVKVNLAVVLLKLGRASAARPLLEAVVFDVPDHRRAWGYLGVALEQLGLLAEAEGALLSGHHSGAVRRLLQRHRSSSAGSSSFADAERGGPPDAPEELMDDEFSFEQTIPPRCALPPPPSGRTDDNRSPVPLLDAALSSLLVLPHRLSAIAHPGGFVVLRMFEGTDPREGGFAARAGLVRAASGTVRKCALLGELETDIDTRWSGTGRLVLVARGRAQLVPLHLDADIAFVREDRVAGFDQRLLFDPSSLRVGPGEALALSRFRGDGEVVLELQRPALAFELEPDEAVTIPAQSLVGWIGPLAVEAAPGEYGIEAPLVVRGEGTLLVAGAGADPSESWQ